MSHWSELDHIYLLGNREHEPKRVERVLKELEKHGAPESKITVTAPTWGTKLTSKECFDVYDPWLERNFPCFVFKSRALTRGEISLVLNFYSAVKDACSKGYERIMVLESDVMFRSDFGERIEALMKLAKDVEWDYISLSDGVGTHTKDMQFGDWYMPQMLKPAGSPFPFRCTDSMIFSRRFLENLNKTLIPFRDCLDWELNYQHYLHGARVWWAEPHLIEQGTQKRVEVSILHTV